MSTYLSRVGVWEQPDGNVCVTYFSSADMRAGETEDTFIERYKNRLKLDPQYSSAIFSIHAASDLPIKNADRGKWRMKNGKVRVDNTIVLPDEDRAVKKASARVKLKALGLSDAELDAAFG